MKHSFPHRPLKKVRLYEEVADQIKQSIFDGHLKPGRSEERRVGKECRL